MLWSSESQVLSVMGNTLTNVHPLTTGLHPVKETPFTVTELYPSLTDQITPIPWCVTDTIHQETCSHLLCTWYCNLYWPSFSISNTVGMKWPNFTWYNESSLTLFQVKVKVKIKIQRHTSVISKSSVFHSRFRICFFLLSHGIHVDPPQSGHWLQSFPKAFFFITLYLVFIHALGISPLLGKAISFPQNEHKLVRTFFLTFFFFAFKVVLRYSHSVVFFNHI